MANNRYCIDLAKRGTAGCNNCKKKIDKGVVRIGKIIPNPFTDAGGDMKQWFHVRCVFDKLSRARATTKKIEDTDDLEGWDDLDDDSKKEVLKCLEEFSSSTGKKTPTKTPKKRDEKPAKGTPKKSSAKDDEEDDSDQKPVGPHKDDLFKEFRRLCAAIAEEPSYNEKTAIISEFFNKGPDKKSFKGDHYLWVKMLLPNVDKRVYNLQSKQIIKLFSQMFDASQEEMMEDLEQGDVAETVRIFFEDSNSLRPAKKSSLYLQEVDKCLEELAKFTKEEEQLHILKKVTKRCTGNDLKIIIRLIKHDLRINAGPKHVLEAFNPTAYKAFQTSRNLKDVMTRCLKQKGPGNMKKELSIRANVLTPILPMLASACKSMDQAFKKCPNGLLVEIKYDGERVQVHKKGDEFSYFSRSLKPVMPHKVHHLKDYIPKAFPHGNDLILDSEILLVDTNGKPLPFGTLGAHKKAAFTDANVCLFVFDCVQFNDENLINKPLSYRRKILEENMTPIKNHIMFSEMKKVKEISELKRMMYSVMDQGLEGLIIKDKESIYEPGKRHWLKMKKDYLEEGSMADSADLVVLGGYYGTGNKGGIMSTFLMGCYDTVCKKWCTVTKVTGGTDAVLKRLQKELDMVKISRDPSKVPSWLKVNKSLVPDFVAADPKNVPVWEISGAEFSKSNSHTSAGISIRFPRVARVRTDKTWKTATTLEELKNLNKASKETTDMIGLGSPDKDEDSDSSSSNSSRKSRSSKQRSEDEQNSTPKKKRKRSVSRTPIKKIKTEELPFSGSETENEDEMNDDAICDPSEETFIMDSETEDVAESSGAKHLKKSDQNLKMKIASKSEDENGKGSADCLELPDIFSGVKLYLPSSLSKLDILKRYFIAYDGVILEEHEKSKATVVISDGCDTKGRPSVDVQRVTVDWLWDCIKLQKTLPLKMYKPKKPS